MKTRIFNLIILDESGSMQSIKQAAIDSVNETIQTIRAAQERNEDQDHYVSFVTFNDEVKCVYPCKHIRDVHEITRVMYFPDRCTALYDAIGTSLNALRTNVEAEDKVLVTIVTDGYENASRKYDHRTIKSYIDELKGMGWVFTYIGANHDVESVASSLSINNLMCFDSSDDGVKVMSEKWSASRASWFDRIKKGIDDAFEDNERFFDI